METSFKGKKALVTGAARGKIFDFQSIPDFAVLSLGLQIFTSLSLLLLKESARTLLRPW